MKILYGVQGTGNGHLTRARCLAEKFQDLDVEVDYLFSGRERDGYFDMEVFGDARYYRGLTFVTRHNRIDHLRTVLNLRPLHFFRELRSIDVSRYDLVISDFEPLTAWRARYAKVPTLGVGHQYSFLSGAPWPRRDFLGKLVLRYFAPVEQSLGMHWHHFDGPVLPPMIDTGLRRQAAEQDFTLVYLPFDDPVSALSVLQSVPDINFIFYSPHHTEARQAGNVAIEKLSKGGFRRHLQQCRALVSSCGFGLVSEALHLGIPIMTVPVVGQGEQIANAMALETLGIARCSQSLSRAELLEFHQGLASDPADDPAPMSYPDVANEVAKFCADGAVENIDALVRRLWQPPEMTPQTGV